MSEELKPCPFCGGEATIVSERETFQIVGCRSELFMLCPTPTIVVYKTNGIWIYDAWNTRSQKKSSADSAASKVLRDKSNSKSAKTAAGSALSQPRRKGR